MAPGWEINIIETDLRWAILRVAKDTTLELLLENTQMSMSNIITDSLCKLKQSPDVALRA